MSNQFEARRFSADDIITHRDAAACTTYLRSLAHSTVGDVLGEQRTWEALKALRPNKPSKFEGGLG